MFDIIMKIFFLLSSFKRYYYILKYRFVLSGKTNVRLGKNLKMFNHVFVKISSKGRVEIGDNFTFSSGGGFNSICRNIEGSIDVRDHARLIIGNNVSVSSPCIWVKESVTIGNNVKIGGDCVSDASYYKGCSYWSWKYYRSR